MAPNPPPTFFKQLNAVPEDSTVKMILVLTVTLGLLVNKSPFLQQTMLVKSAILLSLVSISFSIYCAITIFYRLWFHPLAKFPGPFLARFTDWYSVYHCAVGDRHLDFKRLHDKYGSIVRYGPHRIAINTNTGLRDIYHVRANCQKSQYFSVFSHFFKVPMSMTTIDRKAHAFKRRVDAEALTTTAIQPLEEAVLRNVRKFCCYMIDNPESAHNGWSVARNMSEWCGYLMTDTMGDITFHRNWKMMDCTENRALLKTLSEGVAGLNMMGHMQGILEMKIDKVLFRGSTKGTYMYKELSEDQSRWRIEHASEIKEPDLFGALLEARDPESGRGFTQEELISEAGLLIIAGSQTSATAIVSVIFYVLQYPDCLAKVTAEVLRTFISLEEIRGGPDLHSCNYLRACLDESMRLSPGVGGILPREILAGGMTVDNAYFPPGTDIGVANYAIHHNEAYFPDPYRFRPERWLLLTEDAEGVSAEQLILQQSAYAPFSVGRASCVGKNLAYQEITIVLARLIWLYEMRLEPGNKLGEGAKGLGSGREMKEEFQTYDNFVAAHNGPMVQFRLRGQREQE